MKKLALVSALFTLVLFSVQNANAQQSNTQAGNGLTQEFTIGNSVGNVPGSTQGQKPKSLQNALNNQLLAPVAQPNQAVNNQAVNVQNGQLIDSQVINQVANNQMAIDPSQVVTINEEDLPWLQKKEPPKNENNLIRLIFDEVQEGLKPDDKTALKSVVNKLQKDMTAKALLKSYAKPRGENAIKARQAALRRTLEIRNFFETNGVDFKRISVQIMGDSENSLGLDYIDIDKI